MNGPVNAALVQKVLHFYETGFLILMRLAEAKKLNSDEIALWIEHLKGVWSVLNELGVGVDKEDLMAMRGGEWLTDANLQSSHLGRLLISTRAKSYAAALR